MDMLIKNVEGLPRSLLYLCSMLLTLYKYRYILLFAFFGLWMLFFDSNNVFYRVSISAEVSDLEESRDIYQNQIADLRRQRTALFGNQNNLEKFAREKYMMKKDNEDLFIIIHDTTPQND